MIHRWARHALVLAVLAVATATVSRPYPHLGAVTRAEAAPGVRFEQSTYATRGTIKQIGDSRLWATIAHEDIPGFMPAMTMKFMARDARQLAGLNPGDAIQFTFTVDSNGRLVLTTVTKR